MATNNGVTVIDYMQQPSATLAVDGYEDVETTGKIGTTYTIEYREILSSGRFFSESAWNALTGDNLDLAPGTVTAVFNSEGNSGGRISNDITRLTNPVTGQTLPVKSVDPVLKSDLLYRCRVLDDSDYAAITTGLTDEWLERQVFFNAPNGNYAFAGRTVP